VFGSFGLPISRILLAAVVTYFGFEAIKGKLELDDKKLQLKNEISRLERDLDRAVERLKETDQKIKHTVELKPEPKKHSWWASK
jgi:hypothetical protein